jgi:hypothetical protein
MEVMAFIQWDPTTGASRAGSFGGAVTTVHTPGIDFSVTLDAEVVGGNGLGVGDVAICKRADQGATIAATQIAQMLARAGAGAEIVRCSGVDAAGAAALVASPSDLVLIVMRSTVRG